MKEENLIDCRENWVKIIQLYFLWVLGLAGRFRETHIGQTVTIFKTYDTNKKEFFLWVVRNQRTGEQNTL